MEREETERLERELKRVVELLEKMSRKLDSIENSIDYMELKK